MPGEDGYLLLTAKDAKVRKVFIADEAASGMNKIVAGP